MCVVVVSLLPPSPPSSPAEELSFGSGENEKKSLIILSNVTKNQVAFKVSCDGIHMHPVCSSDGTKSQSSCFFSIIYKQSDQTDVIES